MKIKISKAALQRLKRIDQVPVGKEVRYYYVAGPKAMFHMVSRIGPLELLNPPVIVEANLGWGEGWHGKCHPHHEGLKLTKVTIRRILDGPEWDKELDQIIQESKSLPRRTYRTPRWGGEKGQYNE